MFPIKGEYFKMVKNGHLVERSIKPGTTKRPCLNILSESVNIYVQILDDEKGVTLTASSTRDIGYWSATIQTAQILGWYIATKALEKGITEVVVQVTANYNPAHVKALLEGARKAGLKF